MINVAILGYGVVGSGVYKVITENNDVVSKNVGDEIKVSRVLDLREFPGDPAEEVLTHDYDDILNDDSIDIVVEVMGGLEPANTFVRKAIEKGKSVCTSNKALVAAFGTEILDLAREKGVNFLFEASVGGGIPVLRAINESLTADHFDKIYGILNGTTNYILTKMSEEGLSFDTVLKDAQEKGYAERNPEADIEGYDACRKIAILTSLVYGRFTDFEEISTEGITKITNNDMIFARAAGMSIKLFGLTEKNEKGFYSMVAPFLVGREDPLFSVNGVYNAVNLHGDMLEDVMFYGQGAGSLPTASAVVSDVIELAKNKGKVLPYGWTADKITLSDINEYETAFYVRVNSGDAASFKNSFENVKVIEAPEISGEVAFITEKMSRNVLTARLRDIEPLQIIRVN
ncbi:MAG: homoserine dehydrogenase [Eubacterium sp.]|nr:homoserine dehydrogenase [Eubacterium sp.]